MATGVLVVGVNRATRLLGHLSLTEKEYVGTIRLGISTVTDDAEGDVLSAPGSAGVTLAAVSSALPAFTGPIMQRPTAVSAIKVDGVRSYTRVRAGEDVDLPAREVIVSRFEILSDTAHTVTEAEGTEVAVMDLEVAVTCSSGTYVRALARDIGTALGTVGHLTALRRTRVGPYSLDAAQTIEQAAEGLALTEISDVARTCFPTLVLDATQEAWVRTGRRLPGVALPGPLTALMTSAGEFLALYAPDGDDAVAESVFVA